MKNHIVEITEVIETEGKEPFLTVLGTFLVIPAPSVAQGSKSTVGKKAFINPQDYEQIRGKEAMDVIRYIKDLVEVV